MPTYSAISNAEVAVNKPLTSSLMTRMRDNPLAIFEALGWGTSSKRSISAEQTITTGGTVTINHGLVSISNPLEIDVQFYLVCKTSEGGYTAGDIVAFAGVGQGSSASTGISATITTTQIVIRYGSSGQNITQKTTGGAFTITAANWRLVVKARG